MPRLSTSSATCSGTADETSPSARSSSATTLVLGQSPPPKIRRSNAFVGSPSPQKKKTKTIVVKAQTVVLQAKPQKSSGSASKSKTKTKPSKAMNSKAVSTTKALAKTKAMKTAKALAMKTTLAMKTKAMKTVKDVAMKCKAMKTMKAMKAACMKAKSMKAMKSTMKSALKSTVKDKAKKKPAASIRKPWCLRPAQLRRYPNPQKDLWEEHMFEIENDFVDMQSYNESFGIHIPDSAWDQCFAKKV